MRLLLLAVISFTWSGVAFGQLAPVHIPSQVDSIAHAVSTMTATVTPGIIQIDANIDSSNTFNNNVVQTIQGLNSSIVWDSTGNTNFNLTGTTNTIPMTIKNITMSKSVSVLNQKIVQITSLGVGESM